MAQGHLFAGTNVSDRVVDRGEIWDRVDSDADLLRSLIEIYRTDAPRLLAEIANAIALRDPAALERAAHTLKGSTSVFAAAGAVAIASTLEQLGRASTLDTAAAAHTRMVVAVGEVVTALDLVAAEGPP